MIEWIADLPTIHTFMPWLFHDFLSPLSLLFGVEKVGMWQRYSWLREKNKEREKKVKKNIIRNKTKIKEKEK